MSDVKNAICNPNEDESIRGQGPKVSELPGRFSEIIHEELDGLGIDISTEVARIVPRLVDAVNEIAMADPH